jgi:hypothetical protein
MPWWGWMIIVVVVVAVPVKLNVMKKILQKKKEKSIEED